MTKHSIWLLMPFIILPFIFVVNESTLIQYEIFTTEINIYLSSIIAISLFPISYGLACRNLDLFEPSILFMLGVVLGFVLPAYMFTTNTEIKGFYLVDYQVNQYNLTNGLKFYFFSFLFFLLGYYLFRGEIKKPKKLSINLNENLFRIMFYIFILLYLIGAITSQIVLGEQTVRGLSYEFGYGIFQPFTGLSNFLIIVWLVFFLFSNNLKGSPFLHLVMLIILITSFDISSRGGILATSLAILASLNYLKFRIKLSHGIFLLLIALIPIVGIGLGRYDVADTATDIFFNFFRVAYLATFSGLEVMMIISDQVPQNIDFYKGSLVLGAFIYPFFPRIIFPGKPEVYGYNLFWEDYLSASTIGKSEYFVSLAGHFYLDFGIFGIIVGCFLLGTAYSKIYKFFRLNINNKGIVVVYILACVTVFFQTPFAIPTSMVVLQIFALPIIFLVLIYKKNKSQET